VRVGDYRIVYAVEDRSVLAVVLKVANRAEVYQRIRESDADFLRRLIGK
jgi:mRNA-degrading endonuclease RelE of RelBE toxin-antitoxin system